MAMARRPTRQVHVILADQAPKVGHETVIDSDSDSTQPGRQRRRFCIPRAHPQG
jgi:hypothetical protein